MNDELQKHIPDQVGRFDDSFNANCIGDQFTLLGVPTILFEAGHYPNDYYREYTRKMIFVALISGLQHIYENVIVGDKIANYLGITKKLRYNTTIQHCEKYLLRKSVEMIDPNLLPSEILWRTKEAFSDGVSSMTKSWFTIIQEKINALNNINPVINNALVDTRIFYEKSKISTLNPPQTLEQVYYRYLYNKDYKNCDHLIEYFWMPKYVNANDASARTLKFYNEKNTNKI